MEREASRPQSRTSARVLAFLGFVAATIAGAYVGQIAVDRVTGEWRDPAVFWPFERIGLSLTGFLGVLVGLDWIPWLVLGGFAVLMFAGDSRYFIPAVFFLLFAALLTPAHWTTSLRLWALLAFVCGIAAQVLFMRFGFRPLMASR